MGFTKSTDSGVDAVGRTGWDVLHSSSRTLLLLAFLIVVIIALYLFRDDLPESETVREYADPRPRVRQVALLALSPSVRDNPGGGTRLELPA